MTGPEAGDSRQEPARVRWFDRTPEGRAWLAALPGVVRATPSRSPGNASSRWPRWSATTRSAAAGRRRCGGSTGLVGDLGLDRERARGWAIGQTIAWSFQGDAPLRNHVETARWLLDAG